MIGSFHFNTIFCEDAERVFVDTSNFLLGKLSSKNVASSDSIMVLPTILENYKIIYKHDYYVHNQNAIKNLRA